MTLRTTRAARWTLSGVLAIFLLSIPLAAQTPGLVGNPSPANGAVGVPTAVALSWSAATDARRYDVRLGTTASPPVVARNVNGTTYQPEVPLAPGTTYFWRVDARGRGNTVTPGPVWTFTTAAAPTPPPAVPASPAPPSGATGVAITTSVSWAASANATSYDVAFGTTDSPPVVSSNQTGTSFDPPGDLSQGTPYFWRVTAKGPGGSTQGPLWTFTTAAAPQPPPAAPASPSPVSGATGVAITTSVSWAASANATSYDVAFGTTNTPPVVSSNQTGTSFDPPGDLSQGTPYFWRVTAKGPGGTTQGPLWTFTTASGTPPPPSTSLERLRLMTWNIRQGRNKANALAVDAQVELMADSGAHIIILQEVTINFDGDLTALYESKLEALTGKTWNKVWAPAPRPTTDTPEGNLILTTLPIASSSTLEMDTDPGDPKFLDTKRSAVHVAVVVNGVTVNVFGTHLAVNATHRQAQLNLVQDWVSTFATPRLVAGDLNFEPGEAAHADMAGLFADVWPALAGGDPGFTMDSRSQTSAPGRIDYWWHEKTDTKARATEVWLIKTKRSDHHALVIDVEVK